MKLALITPEWGAVAGGIATYYRHLVPALRAGGVDVSVFSGSPFVTGRGEADGVQQLNPEALNQRRRHFRQLAPLGQLQHHLAASWALFDQVSRHQFDLIECADWGLTALPWVETEQPLVVRCHASLAQIAQRERLPGEQAFQSITAILEQSALRLADGVATYAHANAADWQPVLGRTLAVMRPPFPVQPDSRLGETGLVAGKVQRWKGVETLCRALESNYDGPAIHWFGRDMPYGESGVADSTARVMANRYPSVWGSRIVPKGMVSPDQLALRQREAAFMVVPSSWDVFNFTVVEGMAHGIPMVVSDGAGASELIEHGVSGWVFESGNADACRLCLDQLLGLTDAQRQAVGAAGRDVVASELDPARAATRHAEHYSEVLAGARRAPSSLWRDLLAEQPEPFAELDVINNLAGKDLLRALLRRGRRRLSR